MTTKYVYLHVHDILDKLWIRKHIAITANYINCDIPIHIYTFYHIVACTVIKSDSTCQNMLQSLT